MRVQGVIALATSPLNSPVSYSSAVRYNKRGLQKAKQRKREGDVRILMKSSILNSPYFEPHRHFTLEKTFGMHRVYVYYYRTLPCSSKADEVYAIVDFIRNSEA